MSANNKAIASLVCGILSVLSSGGGFYGALGVIGGFVSMPSLVLGIIGGFVSMPSLVLGIVAVVLSISAKKEGFTGGMQAAGMVLGVIGVVLGGISLLGCVVCVACMGAAGALS